MRIKELFIKRYGPLQGVSYTLSHPFTLLVGNNEDGKTLTIDALVRLLLGKQVKGFEKIDRVAETPEGYVVIEDNEGNEMKLPERGTLTDVTGITSSECRNIFVIRDSDLSIATEGEFYTQVTDRLTGLRTKELSAIKKELQDIGKLTRPDSGGALSDREEFENIKSRVEDAGGLLEIIDEVQYSMQKERYDELEEEVVRQREGIERIENRIEYLEHARRREKYEKGSEALQRLKDALGKLNELKLYNEADSQLWRDCDRDILSHNEVKEKLGVKLKGIEKELRELEEKLGEKTWDFNVLESRKKRLDDARADVNLHEMKRKELVQKEQSKAWWLRMLIVSTLLLGISLFGLIVRPFVPFYIAAPLFLIAAAVSLIPLFQRVRDQAWLAGSLERIKLMLSKFELRAETIEDINTSIQRFEELHHRKFEEIQGLTRRKENLEERVAEIQNRTLPSEERKINDAQERIDTIRKKTRAESRDGYGKELKLKQQYEKSVGEQRGILESHLGTKGEPLEQTIAYWYHELKSLEEYRDKSKELEYNERVVSQLQEEKNEAVKKLDDLNDKMAALRRQLEEIERRANGILRLEADYLHCETSIDLEAVKETLQSFINENENAKDTALKVMEIFEAIELEKKKMVSEHFGHGSVVARYFAEITDGRYEEVFFDQEGGTIEVRRNDGIVLPADKLSGGAYDQLYLAIRLALGEKTLEGKKGFFIMDDPFVKADPARLQKQIEVLKGISQAGWQIIYFSAKGEMREVAKPLIKRGAVNCVEIQAISS